MGARRFLRYWLPVLAYVGLIFVLSAQPGLRPPFDFQNSDKFAHTLEYGVLGFLLVRAIRAGDSSRPLTPGLLALAIGMAIGMADEIFQSTVPGRESSIRDFLADTGGLLLAQIAFLVFRR